MAKYIHVQAKAFADTLRGMVLNKIWIFFCYLYFTFVFIILSCLFIVAM